MQVVAFRENVRSKGVPPPPRSIRISTLARKSKLILGAQQLRGKILWNKDLALQCSSFLQIAPPANDLLRSLSTSRLRVTCRAVKSLPDVDCSRVMNLNGDRDEIPSAGCAPRVGRISYVRLP